MILETTPIDGVLLVRLERLEDERGWFARTFCVEEFAAAGFEARVAQASVSHNAAVGTLRGMHLQQSPHGEAKLVRCTRGRVWDAVVDVRDSSPTRRRWWATELSQDSGTALYIGEGIAHGFVTLEPHSELEYLISVPYELSAAAGVRWDDPAFGIDWPMQPTVMSERDRSFPDFAP